MKVKQESESRFMPIMELSWDKRFLSTDRHALSRSIHKLDIIIRESLEDAGVIWCYLSQTQRTVRNSILWYFLRRGEIVKYVPWVARRANICQSKLIAHARRVHRFYILLLSKWFSMRTWCCRISVKSVSQMYKKSTQVSMGVSILFVVCQKLLTLSVSQTWWHRSVP